MQTHTDAPIIDQSVEAQVRNYFADTPILADIAKCESGFRHNSKSGGVFRGKINRSDVGVMQINEYYHGKTAEKFDLNLHEFGDNLMYARYLYEREGTAPWNASKKCWSENAHLAQR